MSADEALATWLRVRRQQGAVGSPSRKAGIDIAPIAAVNTRGALSAPPCLLAGREHVLVTVGRSAPGDPRNNECLWASRRTQARGLRAWPSEDPDGGSPTAILIEVSRMSDLQRLSQLLTQGTIKPFCAETFAAAVQDGNPAVVEMILRHGSEHSPRFLDTFHSWARRATIATVVTTAGGSIGGQSPPTRCILPLHSSCHAGSPEVVNVLLAFMAERYSSEVFRSMVNAKDVRGRTALHLASWSPRPLCPGRRHEIIRNLLAHHAFVHAKDNRGRTALHEACRAADYFAVEILLKAGASPLAESDDGTTPLEGARRKYRRLLEGVFQYQLTPPLYLQLCAKIVTKSVVSRILRRFEPLCDTCRVRPAQTCSAQKQENFAGWLYTQAVA